MSKCLPSILSILALGAGAAAFAQGDTDRAFTATGTRCEDVTWSQDSLAKYPRIASACQGVTERNGKYYVKFQGRVERLTNAGRTLTIQFKDGDRVTVTPPRDMSVDISGTKTPMHHLERGTLLTFYVPQDQLAAEFAPENALEVTPPLKISPPEPQRVALVPHATMGAAAPALPKTASPLPALGLCGVLLAALGALLTMMRRLGRFVV